METEDDPEKQTYSKALIKRLKRTIKPAREKILKEDDINSAFKYIVREVFGFQKEHEIANLKIIERSYCYLGVQIDDEIKYIIECRSPKLNLENGSPNQTFEYGAKHNSEWIIRTNGIDWEIYRSNCDKPNEYNLVCVFNFLELNLENKVDLSDIGITKKPAAKILWPSIPKTGKSWTRTTAKLYLESKPSYISRLIERLPSLYGIERLPSLYGIEPKIEEYLALLDRVLEDRIITEEEAYFLTLLGEELGLYREQIIFAHNTYMRSLVRVALENGIITASEKNDLEEVSF